jgi:hypothetical protein
MNRPVFIGILPGFQPLSALFRAHLRKLHSSYPAWTRAQARAAHPRAAAVNARYAIRHIQSARPC